MGILRHGGCQWCLIDQWIGFRHGKSNCSPIGRHSDATVERHHRRVFASWRILVACGISRNGGGIVLQSTCKLKLGMEVEMVGGIVDVTAGKHFLHSVVLL